MTNNETLTHSIEVTGNKLIAEYMGYTYYGFNDERLEMRYEPGWKLSVDASAWTKVNESAGRGRDAYLGRHHTCLDYQRNWNTLLEAVKKILTTSNSNFRKQSKVHYALGRIDQKEVWEAVVEYLIWLKNKEKNHE